MEVSLVRACVCLMNTTIFFNSAHSQTEPVHTFSINNYFDMYKCVLHSPSFIRPHSHSNNTLIFTTDVTQTQSVPIQ